MARARHDEIDAAARTAGRAPEDVRRALDVIREPDRSTWLDTLLRLAHKRFQTFIVSAPGDPLEVVRALAGLAPRLRDKAGEVGVS